MRKICIHQKGASKVEVFDESDIESDEFYSELTKLLLFNNISMLKTSSSTLLIRPSQIQSIHVSEVPESKEETIPESKDESSVDETSLETEKPKPKMVQDTITDK